MPFTKGLELWLEYNWRIRFFAKERGLQLIEFTSDTTEFMRQVQALIEVIDLPNKKASYSFFENEMRHTELPEMEGVEPALIRKVLKLYEELKMLVFCRE